MDMVIGSQTYLNNSTMLYISQKKSIKSNNESFTFTKNGMLPNKLLLKNWPEIKYLFAEVNKVWYKIHIITSLLFNSILFIGNDMADYWHVFFKIQKWNSKNHLVNT